MTFDEFVVHISAEKLEVRNEANFAYQTITRMCPRAFQGESRLAKDYLSSRASAVYACATTYPQLDALRLVLLHLYNDLLEKHPNLLEPHQVFPNYRELPVINSTSPPLQFQGLLHQAVDKALCSLKNQPRDIQYITLLLALARQCGLEDMNSLLSLFDKQTKAHLLQDAARIILVTPSGESYLLDAPAFALWRQLKAYRPINKVQYNKLFDRWFDHHQQHFLELQKFRPSLKEALSALVFCVQSLAARFLGSNATPLPASLLLSVLTGQTLTHMSAEHSAKKRLPRKRRASFLKIIQKTAHPLERPFGFNPILGSPDKYLIDALREAVTEFEHCEPRQSRRSRAFKVMKDSLLSFISEAYQDQKISHTAWNLCLYCIDLMLHGSTQKSKLRVSTILTYLSRLTALAKMAWVDEQLLVEAQHSSAAIDELTERVAEALSEFNSDSEQATVVNFLSYLQQTSSVRFFDPDELEYYGAYAPGTRAHYISPHDFDSACTRFLKIKSGERLQVYMYAMLCYRLGLRSKEARQLLLDDVRFDCDDVIVSRRLLRKTQRAVRRVRLAFLTITDRVNLERYVAERKAMRLVTLFDEPVLDALQNDFIKTLRAVSGISDAVIHSLRHSAANNMLFQLSLSCIPSLLSCRDRYDFLRHETFGDQQLGVIQADIAQAGRRCDLYFPVLDTLANLLGHVSPIITVQNYLHLFDVLGFELSAQRERPLPQQALTQLVTQNQYRYAHKRRYLKPLTDNPESANRYVFEHFSRGFDAPLYQRTSRDKEQHEVCENITFSEYLLHLQRYFHEPETNFSDRALLDHFRQHADTLNFDFYQHWKTRDFPVWLRLFERLSTLEANQVNLSALAKFSALHAKSLVSSKRDLNRCLRAFDLLGLHQLQFVIRTTDASSVSPLWLSLIAKAGHSHVVVEEEFAVFTAMKLRPRGLRYAPWEQLPAVLSAFQSYLNLLDHRSNS